MSFCKNCGTNIGEANFCPACGQATTETAQPQNSNTGFSEYYPELCEYSSRATKIFVFGILSLIFCMGIGIVFEIICLALSFKIKKPFEHRDKLITPAEIAMCDKAISRHKSGAIMSSIAVIITGILLFVLFMSLMILIQTR